MIDNNDIIILEGGFSDDSFIITNEFDNFEPGEIFVDNPSPKPGTRVEYDGEGHIMEIINVENTEVFSVPVPSKTRNYDSQTFRWGVSNNKLIKERQGSQYFISATGRFTVFFDRIGNYNNVLKKGDCAVKYSIDNPPTGTAITAEANGRRVTFYKHDVGGMPDAILDIWNTGVEYLGQSPSSYWSTMGLIFYNY